MNGKRNWVWIVLGIALVILGMGFNPMPVISIAIKCVVLSYFIGIIYKNLKG